MRGVLVIIALVVVLAGCTANDVAIFRQVGIDKTQATAVDAKQRFLITVKNNSGVKFCAEPSPDALSAISSSLATSMSVGVFGQGEGAGQIASSLQEAATQIGKRNATIQLFRDGWYRLCEGTLNGAVGRTTHTLLATKYADSTVVWLAIEELSGLTANSAKVGGGTGTTANATTEIGGTPEEAPPDAAGENTSQVNPTSAGGAVTAGFVDPSIGIQQRLLHYTNLLAQTEPDPNDAGAQPEEPAEDVPADDPRPSASASGSASAGGPEAGATGTGGRGANPSDMVAKATAVLVSDYLHRARFNDCLLALDNMNLDLTAGGAKNDAMSAIIDGCKQVIANQAERNRVAVEILGTGVSEAPSEEAPGSGGTQ